MNDNAVRLDPAEIGRTLDDLAAIGNRYAGTPGEAIARDYLLERFKAWAWTTYGSRRFRTWDTSRGSATCALGRARARVPPAPVHGHRRGGRRGGLPGRRHRGRLRADRRPRDRPGREDRGRPQHVPVRPGRDALEERGIAGLVHVCETPEGIVGNFTGALYPPPLGPPWEGRPTPYCGVTISHPDGRVLISELSCGRPVEIRLEPPGRVRRAHRAQRGRPDPRQRAGRGDPLGALRQPGRGTVRVRQRQRPGQPARDRAVVARRRSAPDDRAARVGGRGDRGMGRDGLCTRARARDGGCPRHGQPGRDRQRVPLAASDLVGRRRAARAGGADRPGPGLGARPGHERPQHILRPRTVHRRRRAGLPDLAPRLPVLPLPRRRPGAGSTSTRSRRPPTCRPRSPTGSRPTRRRRRDTWPRHEAGRVLRPARPPAARRLRRGARRVAPALHRRRTRRSGAATSPSCGTWPGGGFPEWCSTTSTARPGTS